MIKNKEKLPLELADTIMKLTNKRDLLEVIDKYKKEGVVLSNATLRKILDTDRPLSDKYLEPINDLRDLSRTRNKEYNQILINSLK